MEEQKDLWTIQPGHGLGSINLGASLQGVLTFVKADTATFPAIEIIYSQAEPLTNPVILHLPRNGLRLRFDGPDQRLRLIEIMDFGRCQLAYKGSELVKQKEDAYISTGPAFRRVYQIFGAAFPGQYLEPAQGSYSGTYILSWPGVAFSFPLQHAAWAPNKDHVSLLGSQAASPASHMAIFEGTNWTTARKDMFNRIPAKPRSMSLAARPRDAFPSEIDSVFITADGHLELARRSPASALYIRINETTPEDLITELGPPDTKHKRDLRPFAPEQASHRRSGSTSKPLSNVRHVGSLPSSCSSTATDTYDIDFDHDDADADPMERASRETFWCYFSHGFDILVGPPTSRDGNDATTSSSTTLHTTPYLVVTKVILHGNVPGSYAFNRHRRIRWSLDVGTESLSSESSFETTLKPALLKIFSGMQSEAEMARGKVVNRTWSGSPTDSSFFLPDEEEDLIEGVGSEQWLGNTRLYRFPRLSFEAMENGAVSALTVS